MNKDLYRTIQAGCLIDAHMPLLAETLDSFQGNSVITTYAPRLRPDRPWRSQIMENWMIVSTCIWPMQSTTLRCIVSKEGQVNLYGPGGVPDCIYQIPEAGVFGKAAAGHGYVNRVRVIDHHLYVCGQSRQVYRFSPDANQPLNGQWQDLAGTMRQSPISAPPEGGDEEAFEAWLDTNNAIDFVDLGGSAEADLYCIGDETWHWNGQTWQQLTLPTDEPLTAIQVLDQHTVLLAGRNGALLKGNARQGFTCLAEPTQGLHFTGIALFNGCLFLPSNQGMFVFDPVHAQLAAYSSGLEPELQDCRMVEAKDGVLWSFGFKDLAWFDGENWTRIQHPDNAKIT